MVLCNKKNDYTMLNSIYTKNVISHPRPGCCKFVSKGEFSFGELQLYKRANSTAGIRIYNEPIKFILNKTIPRL